MTTGLTEAGLAYLRSELGDEVDEDDLFDRYARLGDLRDVAMEVVRQRLSNVLSGSGSFNVPGVYAEDNTSVIRGLQAQIQRLAQAKVDERDGSADPNGELSLVRIRLVPRRQR